MHGREQEHEVEELDEDDMVEVDVNWVDEELERRRDLDASLHRALLEVPSEVTLRMAEEEKEGKSGTTAGTEGKDT